MQKWNVLPWLTLLGRNSLYIYVMHVIVFASVRILLSKVFGIQNVAAIIVSGIASGLLIPMFLYNLAVKWNMRFLFSLEKNDGDAQKISLTNNLVSPTSKIKI